VLIDLISNARRLSWTGGGQCLSDSTSSGSSPCNSQKWRMHSIDLYAIHVPSFEKSCGVGNTVVYFNTTWNCTSTQSSFSISSCTFRHSLAVWHKCMDSASLSPTHSFSLKSFNYWLDLICEITWYQSRGVVWICLLWVAISGSETKCIYNSFTNELDVFWMHSNDIQNWISLCAYDDEWSI
jgi:hypothetical protein